MRAKSLPGGRLFRALGTSATAAGGGRKEQEEWQRSKKRRDSRGSDPIVFSGTATGHNGPGSGRISENLLYWHNLIFYLEAYRRGHNGPDSKSGSGQPLVGSNPTASAMKETTFVYRTKVVSFN